MDREPTSTKEFVTAYATLGEDRCGQRLQEALVGLFPDWLPSRKSCRKALDRGDIRCNGQVAGTALFVKEGDRIDLCLGPVDPPDPGRQTPRNLQVHRPDGANYAVVWKPAGIATNGPGHRHLAGIVAHQAHHGTPDEQAALHPIHPDGMPFPRPVHRLDKATAGWVCLALTLRAAATLGAAFADRTVSKRYLALAAGKLENGRALAPLDGKAAETAWHVLDHGPLPVHGEATLLEVRPTTGRTHQIRRHLADLGYPLVGEDAHAAPGMDPQSAPRYTGHGLFLCAIGLSIPEGEHGPATDLTAPVPRKYKRIRWAAEALIRHGYS